MDKKEYKLTDAFFNVKLTPIFAVVEPPKLIQMEMFDIDDIEPTI